MVKTWIRAAVPAAMAMGLVCGPAGAQTAAQVHQFAASLLNGLQCTQYDYEFSAGYPRTPGAKPGPMLYSPAQGQTQSFTDCSGFAGYALFNASSASVPSVPGSLPTCPPDEGTLNTLRATMPTLPASSALAQAVMAYWNSGIFGQEPALWGWPRAFTWTYLFNDIHTGAPTASTAAKHLTPVTDFRTLAAGDVVAWCYDEYCTAPGGEHPKDSDTGHIVIVDAAQGGPYSCGALPAAPADSASVIGLPVIDSSSVQHFPYTKAGGGLVYGTGRGAAPDTATGLGAGCLAFALDGSGAPMHVAFCPAKSSPDNCATVAPTGWNTARGNGNGTITGIRPQTNFVTAARLTGQ